jgi:alanine dehydrogenase
VTLVLREDDVKALLSMPDVVEVLDAAFRHQAAAQAINLPRARVVTPQARGVLHVLPAYVPGQPGHPDRDGPGLVGLKSYTAFAGRARFVVLLYAADDGRLLALIEADWLGQMRTGAASGLATRYMARDDARIVGLIGAGQQARTQVVAMCVVRPIERVLVYGRNPERTQRFCTEMAALTGVAVEPVETAEAAVRPADIVVTATTAREPVVEGSWLRPGMHLNIMGSNWHHRREVDDETIERSNVVAVDALDQARIEAGDLLIPAEHGTFSFDRAVELGQIVAGEIVGRGSPEAITLFKSLGIGLEDVATAGLVYELARKLHIGQELELLP